MIDPVNKGATRSAAIEATRTSPVRVPTSAATAAANPTNRAASVPLPRLLDLVAELTRSGPPVDYARIAQLRRAIADGSYQIDPDVLAKAIVGFAAKD